MADILAAVLRRRPGAPLGVYYRESDLPDREAVADLRCLVRACRAGRVGRPVIVRGRADLALAAGAHGVHLQAGGVPPAELRRRWPSLLLGYSAHSAAEVGRVAPRVDYVTFSPVWASPGKGQALGLAALGRACRVAGKTPVLALGGVVSPDRVRAALGAGAAGAATIRGVGGTCSPVTAVLRLVSALGADGAARGRAPPI